MALRVHALITLLVVSPSLSQAQTLKDVPASYWARAAVADVVSRGVMAAPAGKFDGSRKVTRRELAVTLAALARSLEAGRWPKSGATPLKRTKEFSAPPSGPVTRYVLAAAISKVARYVAAGLPASTGKTYYESVILPKPPKITVPKSDPAYTAVSYLASGRMAFGPSVVLKPGPQPVTGKELTQALGIMVAGLNDRLTDEPQNREDLGPPPSKRKPQ